MDDELKTSSLLAAALNVCIRWNDEQGGFIVLSRGVQMLDEQTIGRIVSTLREFTRVVEHTDQNVEHSLGLVYSERSMMLWTVDYQELPSSSGIRGSIGQNTIRRIITIRLQEDE